ncbi:MAG: hypothetical protein ACI94Y_003600 [Maribacter sp.]|jgi:hypothetical protein
MKNYIQFIILFGILLMPLRPQACMYYPHGEDIRVYLFSPTAGNEEGFTPFFYTSRFLNDENHDWFAAPNENLEEWYSYLNEEVSTESIKKLVYDTPYDTLESIVNRKVFDKDPLCDNDMAEYIVNNELNELVDYLLFTRVTEMLLEFDDVWGSEKIDEMSILDQIEEGIKRIESTRDAMLKQRYAYHVIVMKRYVGDYENVINIYKNNFNQNNNASVIKYWALNHVAYCEEQLGRKDDAHLNYARVFFNCHAKKQWVYNNMSKKSALSVLKKVNNNEDKYAILSFCEFKNPGKSYDGLKQLAIMNPNTKVFKALVVREVNKIEDWLLTRRYVKEEPSVYAYSEKETSLEENYRNDFKYSEKIIGFIENLLLANKLEDRGFYELILAHLYFVHESPDMSSKYLNRAERNIKAPFEKHQLRMTKMLNLIINTKNYDADFESKIYAELNKIFLDKEYMKNPNKNMSNLMLALQQNYHKKGMYDRAALFMAWSFGKGWADVDWRHWDYIDPFFYLDKYASIDQVKQFRKIYAGNNQTKLEQLLLADYDYPKDRFWDLIGTKYLRKNDLENALKSYENVADEFWRKEFYYKDYLGRDLFAEEYDYIRSEESDPKNKYVNKANIVEELINKKKAYEKAIGNKKAKLAFHLGNAYYNLSYSGSHWHCLSYMKMSGYQYNGGYDDIINDNYNTCNIALQYFKEAYAQFKDAEYMTDEGHLFRTIVRSIANMQVREENKDITKFWKKCLDDASNVDQDFYEMIVEECPGM